MTNRVVSQDGNVIAADFGRKNEFGIALTIDTDILYHDDSVVLIRSVISDNGRFICAFHILGDLITGRIINL